MSTIAFHVRDADKQRVITYVNVADATAKEEFHYAESTDLDGLPVHTLTGATVTITIEAKVDAGGFYAHILDDGPEHPSGAPSE